MRQVALALTAMFAAASASAQWTGYVQLRDAQRTRDVDCTSLALKGCRAMVQEGSAELLYERKPSADVQVTGRFDLVDDEAIALRQGKVREAFVDWRLSPKFNLKAGRQILTWGVSDYLYVNDIFPKDYDDFFTGGGFAHMKAPVDGVRLSGRVGDHDVEAVVSRAAADVMPRPERFTATAGVRAAVEADNADDQADFALRAASHMGDWDVAGYAASFRARERRYFMSDAGLGVERPRVAHLGLSATGNAAGGVAWIEGAVRHTGRSRANVVSRDDLPSALKLIFGYSREIAQDLTASAQLQLESMLSRDRYLNGLAPGIRPVDQTTALLHLRLQGQWINQTVMGGAQLFVDSEGATHFNPFTSWSPADGWTIEGGANVFNGKPDSRYGAFKDDSNVYVLGRYSF